MPAARPPLLPHPHSQAAAATGPFICPPRSRGSGDPCTKPCVMRAAVMCRKEWLMLPAEQMGGALIVREAPLIMRCLPYSSPQNQGKIPAQMGMRQPFSTPMDSPHNHVRTQTCLIHALLGKPAAPAANSGCIRHHGMADAPGMRGRQEVGLCSCCTHALRQERLQLTPTAV
jgi:hypothetical protein